jgi:hypothetical protein
MGIKFKPRIGKYTPFKLDDKCWCVMNRETGHLFLDETFVHRKWAIQRAKQMNEEEANA